MPLPARLLTLFERYGTATPFALRRVLSSILSEDAPLILLLERVLHLVRPAAEAPGYQIDETAFQSFAPAALRRLEQVLDIVEQMDALLEACADLESMPEGARQMVEDALRSEEPVQRAAEQIRHLVAQPEPGPERGPNDARQQPAAPAGTDQPRTVHGGSEPTVRAAGPPREEPYPVKAVLEVIAGPHAGERFEFERHETFIVGRSSKVNLQLIEDHYFSRHHFLLEFNPPSCYLRDLGSSNSTLVNGRQVTECFLHDGDVISGGKTEIRFSLLLSGKLAGPSPLQGPTDTAGTQSCTEEPPREIPGYEVLQPIAQGALGFAYRARRQDGGQLFTLKFIRPSPPASAQALERFIQEITPLLQIQHPRLVRHHAAVVVHGWLCLITEAIECTDLKQQLNSSGEQLVRLSCAVICQALEGLAHAHERQVVHGDIQPANLLTSNEKGFLIARLADLGLMRSLIDGGLAGLTHHGDNARNVQFLAPELVMNPRAVDIRSDLYALAATLYYLLTGQPPHDFSKRKDPLAVLLGDAPISISRRNSSLPEGLMAIIHRALARDPAQRFASAAQMHRALRPFTKG
jgi:hypothetical protein